MTSVKTEGYVLAEWDYATVCMSVIGRGETGPEAKQNTQEPSNAIFDVLQRFGIGRSARKSSFSVKEATKYNNDTQKHDHAGYQATYRLTIYIQDLEKLAELHDALTGLEGVVVESPDYKLSPDNRTELQEKALTRAYEKAMRRWKHECSVMGLDPKRYQVGNYSTTYDSNYNRSSANTVVTTADEALKFNAGAALVQVSLSMNFWLKDEYKSKS